MDDNSMHIIDVRVPVPVKFEVGYVVAQYFCRP